MPKTLLLADDSVTIQRVIELTFAHEDVRVVSVGDGRRAIQWLDHDTPDIILVDVDVPVLNGYEVAAHVKGTPRLARIPVILLAGAFEPVDQERVRAIGCEGVLVKPFEPQQLVSRVKELLTQAPMPITGAGRSVSASESVLGHAESSSVATFPRTTDPVDSFRAQVSSYEDMTGTPEPLEPPDRNVWEHRDGPPAPTPIRADVAPAAAAPPPPKVNLVNAFSALLAAEQSAQPPAPAATAGALSDASIEDAVRRVLARMTDDLVRRIVVDTAERLIKEEIEKIKANPE